MSQACGCRHPARGGTRATPIRAARPRTLYRTFDQLDAVAVGIAHEADARRAHEVRRALGLHALLVERGEGRVEVVDLDRDVAVAGADLVRLGAVVVVRQLEPGLGIARVGEEMIRGLVADRRGAHVLEAQALRVELIEAAGSRTR